MLILKCGITRGIKMSTIEMPSVVPLSTQPLPRSLENAVVFSSAVQLELMQLDWDPAVLQWEECAPQTDSSGQLLWQGLRVKVGMVFGTPTLRKPLNTGRADYFGAVPNLAARVCSLARPGQSLLDVDNAVVAALDSMMEVIVLNVVLVVVVCDTPPLVLNLLVVDHFYKPKRRSATGIQGTVEPL